MTTALALGFSGTREGMTAGQHRTVERLLKLLRPTEVHHGDCIGADVDFHRLCRLLTIRPIVGHPPSDPKLRAFCDFDVLLAEKGYYARDRDIVVASNVLIATPKQSTRQTTGGTWYTISYAERSKRTIIVWPDGTTEANREETLSCPQPPRTLTA